MTEQPRLIVDNRESSAPITAFKSWHLPFTVEFLPVGDIVYGPVCIERKTIGDFFGSCLSGRLQEQVRQMEANFDWTFVAIIGNLSDLSGIRYALKNYISRLKYVIAQITIIETSTKTSVLLFETDTQLAIFLGYLIKQMGSEGREFKPPIRKKMKDEDIKMSIVMGIPGIGEAKAEQVMKGFKSIADLCSASLEKIQEYAGEKTGEKIYAAIH